MSITTRLDFEKPSIFLPIPSSSSGSSFTTPDVPPLPPPIFLGAPSLHTELIALGVLDEWGNVKEDFAAKCPLPVLFLKEEDVKRKIQIIRQQLVNDTKTVEECCIYFKSIYEDSVSNFRLFGSTVNWLFGLAYYCDALRAVGVIHPERYFLPSMLSELEKQPADIDIRAFIEWVHAGNFTALQTVFENFIRSSPTDKVKYRKPPHPINGTGNHTVTFSTATVDFNFYYELQAEFLCRSNGLEIPCDFLWDDRITSVQPVSAKGVTPWQAFFDRLLNFMYPHPQLNIPGWVRLMLNLVRGNIVNDTEVWNRLASYPFKTENNIPLERILYNRIKECVASHPTVTPEVDILFVSLQTIHLLGARLKSEQIKALLKDYNGKSNNLLTATPEWVKSIVRLLLNDSPSKDLSFSLLLLSGFIHEIMIPEEESRHSVQLVNCRDPALTEPFFLQLGFPVSDERSFYLQLKISPTEAYKSVVQQCTSSRIDQILFLLLQQFVLNAPLRGNSRSQLVFYWKDLKFDQIELRKCIFSQLNNPNKTVQLLNFLLLAALHTAEPVAGLPGARSSPLSARTEMTLLELFPAMYELGFIATEDLITLFQAALHGKSTEIVSCFCSQVSLPGNENVHVAWVRAFLENKTSYALKKVRRLLPRLQNKIAPSVYKNLFRAVVGELICHFPQDALELFSLTLKNNAPFDSDDFNLFCEALNPFANSEGRSCLDKQLQSMGLILERLCDSELGEFLWTPDKERILFHLVDSLLDRDDLGELGKRIILSVDRHSTLRVVFGKYWGFLYEKAFPPSASNQHDPIPSTLLQKVKAARGFAEQQKYQSAVKTLIELVNTKNSSSAENLLTDLFEYVWGGLAASLKKPTFTPLFEAMNLVHDQNVFARFPFLCLEPHILLIEVIAKRIVCFKRPDTFQQLIYIALARFFPHIPPAHKPNYVAQLVSLLPDCTPSSVPLEHDCKNQIQEHMVQMIQCLEGNKPAQLSLVLYLQKMNLIPLGNKSVAALLIVSIVNGLRVVALPKGEKRVLRALVKLLYCATQTYVDQNTVLFLCAQSFEASEIEEGIFWFDHLLKCLENAQAEAVQQIIASLSPDWLTVLSERNKYRELFTLLKLLQRYNGPVQAMQNIFTDNFVEANAQTLLHLFQNQFYYPLLHNIRESGLSLGEILLRTVLSTLTLTTDDLKCFASLLLAMSYQKADLWHSLLLTSASINNPKFKTYIFNVLRDVLKAGLLKNDDDGRLCCWLIVTIDPNSITKELALEWLKDDSELRAIFTVSGTEIVSPNIMTTYHAVYLTLTEDRSLESCQMVVDSYLKISAEFMNFSHEPDCWRLDRSVMRRAKGIHEDFLLPVIYQNIYKRVLNHPASVPLPKEALDTLSKICCSYTLSPNANEVASQLMSEVVVRFQYESWMMDFVCSMKDSTPRNHMAIALQFILMTAEQFNEIKTDDLKLSRRQGFVQSLKKLIKNLKGKHSDEILDFLNIPTLTFFLENDLFAVVNLVIQTTLSLSSAEEKLPLEQQARCQEQRLLHAIQDVGCRTQLLPIPCQQELWILTSKKIAHLLVLNPEYKLKSLSRLYLNLCLCPFSRRVFAYENPIDFYDKIELLIRSLHNNLGETKPEELHHIHFALLLGTLKICEQNKFHRFEALIILIDRFCFEINPKCTLADTRYVDLTKHMMNEVHCVAERFPDYEPLRQLGWLHLQGMVFEIPYITRVVHSESPYIHTVFITYIQLWECEKEQFPLHELEDCIAIFFEKVKQNLIQKNLHEYFVLYLEKTFLSFVKKLLTSGAGEKIAMGKRVGQAIPSLMTLYARRPTKELGQKLKNYVNSIETLRDAARIGVYRGDPDAYWNMCRDHLRYIENKFCPLSMPIVSSSILYCGLNMIDEDCLQSVHGGDNRYPDLKEEIYRQLIYKVGLSIKTPEEASYVLSSIVKTKWRLFLPNNARLNELIKAMHMIKDRKPSK